MNLNYYMIDFFKDLKKCINPDTYETDYLLYNTQQKERFDYFLENSKYIVETSDTLLAYKVLSEKYNVYERCPSYSKTLGIFKDFPVVIHLDFLVIDNKDIICFFETCSRVVDYNLIRDFIKNTKIEKLKDLTDLFMIYKTYPYTKGN